MGYKFICNQLYKYLLSPELCEEILFLDDDQFKKAENDTSAFDFSEVEVLICQPFFMRQPLLKQMPKLKWLQDTGAGFDAADCEYIKSRNITLTNSRGVMSRSIAEDVMLKMLFFARKVREIEQNKRDHYWNLFNQDQWMCVCYTDLYGKTLGILGYGSIGYEIAIRAKAFGMNVIAFGLDECDTTPLSKYYKKVEDIGFILQQSDFVSVNLPLLSSTRHIINREAFEIMKPTAMLINVARGPIVDEQALYEALRDRKIACAACDVFEQEPLSPESPLWELDNMFITSHKAGMGDSWTTLIGELIERNIHHYLAGEDLENIIKL